MGTKDMFTGRLATLVVTMACSSGFLLFGYDQGVMVGESWGLVASIL